jgi:hypothetical protein
MYITIVFYYTLQHVSAVQISHHHGDVGYKERNIQGQRHLSSVINYNNFQKNAIIRLKPVHNNVTEFLSSNLHRTIK